MWSYLARLGAWWLARLEEKSTYAGFAILAVSIGHDIPPAVLDAISWWGPLLATGFIAASTK
jgi:hypothetical protein